MFGLADAGHQCFPYKGAFISGRSKRNGASWDLLAGWPQAAVGNVRHGQGFSVAWVLR